MVTAWLLISGQQHFCWWNRFDSVKYSLFYSGDKGYGVGKTRQRQNTSSGFSDPTSLHSATTQEFIPILHLEVFRIGGYFKPSSTVPWRLVSKHNAEQNTAECWAGGCSCMVHAFHLDRFFFFLLNNGADGVATDGWLNIWCGAASKAVWLAASRKQNCRAGCQKLS